MIKPAYDLRPCSLSDVAALCAKHHGYGSAGGWATYAFAVYEGRGRVVAAYAWQPPPPGAAKAICPEFPQGVLALSRMVAVPKSRRKLKHISKPLRRQMRQLIDRTRWPVLVTYHDAGQGHTGHVYLCSGWEKTVVAQRPYCEDEAGRRVSSYANGKSNGRGMKRAGSTTLHRWEHWACARGEAKRWAVAHGWRRVRVPGKVWRSGSQAYKFVKRAA